MRTWSTKSRSLTADAEPEVVLTDDGGSGLFEGCLDRFPSPAFEVTCDARHTVWVRRTETKRSVGLPPWVLREQTFDEALESIEDKLGVRVG